MLRRPIDLCRAESASAPGQLAPVAAAFLLVGAAMPLWAADADAGLAPRQWGVVPTISITQTFTDNLLLSGTERVSDNVTRLSAGLDLSARTGQVRAFANYSISELLHARSHDRNTSQNVLNAGLKADFFDGQGKLDGTASITQAAVSAFGVQSTQDGRPTQNTTELRTIQLSPSFNGQIGSIARYAASLGFAATDAAKTEVGDGTTKSASLRLMPATAGPLGWRVDATHSSSNHKQGRVTEDSQINTGGSIRLDQWDAEFHASAGVQRTNLSTVEYGLHHTRGVGGSWSPSNRTRLTWDIDRQFYGKSHSMSFEHRTALAVWRLSDSRSLSTSSNALATTGSGQGAVYDLFFTQLASREPDPVKRDALVKALLKDLGIDPQSGGAGGFLSSAATLQDRKDASVAIKGVRSAIVLTAYRTRTSQLDKVAPAQGDLANSAQVNMQGLTTDLSHRLSPDSSVNLTWSDQRGNGVLAAQSNRQRQVGLVYSLTPSPKATLTMGWRRGLYESGATVSYDESSLFATYGVRF